jgi:hypothetical protein
MNLLPVLLAGLAGSVHCAGMCGGIGRPPPPPPPAPASA